MAVIQRTLYRAAPGAGFNDETAQEIGDWLHRISQGPNDSIDTDTVLKEGADPDSPIHDQIEWDDRIAGREYRKQQVRCIINHLIVVECKNGGEAEIKAWHNVYIDKNDAEEKERVYVPLATVRTNANAREQVVAYALRQLNHWKSQYEQFRHLSPVIDAVLGAFEQAQKSPAPTVNGKHHANGKASKNGKITKRR